MKKLRFFLTAGALLMGTAGAFVSSAFTTQDDNPFWVLQAGKTDITQAENYETSESPCTETNVFCGFFAPANNGVPDINSVMNLEDDLSNIQDGTDPHSNLSQVVRFKNQ